MGILKRDQDEIIKRQRESSEKRHEKARERLTKKGTDLTGLIMLDMSIDDSAFEYLLVFPDRVEYVNDGKPSLLGRKGKGVEVIPISRISSVSTNKKLIFEWVHITTSGQTIEFKSDPYNAQILKSKILELMNAPQKTSAVPSQLDPTEQLGKLADLHKAGVLTDQEFAEKKAELLKRI